MADYDILGNIAIIKGEGKTKKEKIQQARELLKIPSVKTVLEKLTNVSGRLRTIKTKHILGEKNLVALYKENDCRFKFNVEKCYFSPRLSNERKLISEKIFRLKMKNKIMVMFAGVGPFPIVIYKIAKPKKIVGIEIGKESCKYFKENLKLNKIPEDRIEIIQGDVKKIVNEDFIKKYGKFDVVVMPRPNLKENFLEQGLKVSKKNTRIFYYGFAHVDEIENLVEELKKEAEKLKRKIKILEVKKAGDIAPYKYRYRIEIKVLN